MPCQWPPTFAPLKKKQQRLVADNLDRLDEFLRQARFAGYVRLLGREEAYQVGALAFMRASLTYRPCCPFHLYAALWLRYYLGWACRALLRPGSLLSEAAQEGLADRHHSPDYLADVRERSDLVLRQMSTRQRVVMGMRSEGYPYRTAAQAVGVTKSTAQRLAQRAIHVAKEGLPDGGLAD